ncbi:MAG: ATP-dependent endonuclease [Promethearchaeota archaeon]
MKIKEIKIENFRGIEDLTLRLENFTVLIGKNGVGKSSILHALNFFKEQNYKLKHEDYYKRELNRSIKISLVFNSLSLEEKSEFSHYIQNDELKVIKIAKGDEINDIPNVSQKYYGERLQHRNFLNIRYETSKIEKKKIYHQLINDEKYNSMPNIGKSSADLIEGHLIRWEEDHADELEPIMDDGQFFGWKGVGAGKLNKFMRFFFIPAVHEYSEEEKAEKSTYLNEILDLTIRRRIIETPELNNFKENTLNKYKQLIQSENESIVQELSNELSQRLDKLSPGCSLFVDYQPGDVNFIETRYGTELQEYGFRGPISTVGHGVQRASFFTLLQYLGEQQVISTIEYKTNEEQAEMSTENKFFILFIIEEPELYQHPNRIRLIKKILQDLTMESNDSPYQFQIICSSHSPYLIDIQNVNYIRLLRKVKEGDEFKVFVKEVDLNIIAQKLKEIWEFPTEIRSDESTLISRLIAIMTSELSEGFFADKVVLVEGLEDQSALYALDQQLNEENFDKSGIVIIPVLGKRNLDRPALIFKELDIPTYVIFDTDSDKRNDDLESHKKCNIALRKIMGDDDIQSPFEQKIEVNWASLDPKLTSIIRDSLEEGYYIREMSNIKEFYQFPHIKDCRKNYKVMEDFIRKCYEDGKSFPILESVIHQIYNL